MPANDFVLGALYVPNFNGIPWSQPGGPYSPVFPKNITGGFDLLSTVAFNTLTGQYIGVCGHSFNQVVVFRDFDYETGMSVAILGCPQCSCVQRVIEPYSDALTTEGSLVNQILYP